MLKKIKLPHIIYSAVALITVVLVLSLTLWAAGGAAVAQMTVIDGEVLLPEEGVRSEYLVGDEIDSTGISLKVGDKIYTEDELEFTVENASAGMKMVEVAYRDGNTYCHGYYPVTYFGIRHLDLHQTPTGVEFDGDGNLQVKGMALWAELSGVPQTDAFIRVSNQPGYEDFDTVIELTDAYYTVNVQPQDESGGYSAEILCGTLKTSLYFVEYGGEMIVLENADRILRFTNESGTDESLTLFITSRGGNAPGKYNVAEGFFLYRNASGNHRYQFDYYLEDGTWASVFHSADIPASIYRRDPDGVDNLIVDFGNVIFSGTRWDWRLAIFNNPNS